MKNGYKILWTAFALKELEKTIEYLEENWTEKELRTLAEGIEEKLVLIHKIQIYFKHQTIKKIFVES